MNTPRLAADEIFCAARAIASPEKRLGYLDGACANDAALRAQVNALLSADAKAGSFLVSADPSDPDATVPKLAAAGSLARGTERAGQIIGRFKLLQQIGEGGFGSVWMAEQREPVVRKVALKIIKLGMDTGQVVARFEQERQALALMDHPNIAKVLDAGATDTGRPYFVMELCTGDSITEYCDRNNLSIAERLDLFAQVCQAVQHAHQKGLIHRDIKPSNILVATQDGRPHAKVIDFGIAKATASRLTEKTLFTEHKQLIGTPQYMSPEQAEGSLDIDTRTDVYSLGVLLYELLTGTTPFDPKSLRSAAYAEIQRIIREVEPPKPSTRLSQNTDTLASVAARRHIEPKKLGTIVRGELDWIVMKCLEKDRQRRYETANGLGMDVRRYLTGEAVLAAPPSNAYRIRKFVRRNRAQVIGAGVVAVALVLGMIGTGLALNRALRAESGLRVQLAETEKAQEAEKARADELKQVSDFQERMLSQVNPTKAGGRLTEDVHRRFAAALAKAQVPEAERGAQADAFRALWARVNATDVAAALIDETILIPAVKAVGEQFKDQPIVDAQLRLAIARRYLDLGLYDAAYPLQNNVLETRRRVLGEEHPDTVSAINTMGVLLTWQGKLAEAEPYFREVLEKRRRLLGEEQPDTLNAINNVGMLLKSRGKLADAEPYLREALEKRRRVLGGEHPSTLNSINNMGFLLVEQGKLAEAEPYYREALEKMRRVLGEEHTDTLNSLDNMAELLRQQRKLAEAEPYSREALEKRRRVLGEEHPDTLVSIHNRGLLLRAQGKLSEAELYHREALEKQRRVLGEENPETLNSMNTMGSLLRDLNRLSEAEPYFRETLEKSRRVLGAEHSTTINSINLLGSLLQVQGRHQEAVDLLAVFEPAARKASTDGNARRLATLLTTLGRARVGLGYDAERFKLAESNLLEAHPIFVQVRGETHKDTLGCVHGLVDLYTLRYRAEPGQGYDAKAAEWKAKLGEYHESSETQPASIK